MEEAEALADRAGIMDRRMLAVGTVAHLRQRYGDSYTIHLVSRTAPHTSDEEMERLRRWVVGNFADAMLEDKSLHGQLKFSVPVSKTTNRLPGILAQFKQQLGPSSQEMGVIGPTESDGVGDDDEDDDAEISSVVVSNRGGRPGSRSRGGAVRTIFAALEANRDFLDLESYSVAPSALEEVFFNVMGSHSSTEEQPRGRKWWWRRWRT
jgi:ATP-binding cassette, subfamily A (ABC1), member 3